MKKGILIALILVAQSAWSQLLPGIRLGVPSYGGSGCNIGTASVSISPDENEISILFDDFRAEAGAHVNRMVDYKACELSLPIFIPQGYSVAVIQADFRGFSLAPAGGRNILNTEYFWAGSNRGIRYTDTFRGPDARDYTVTNGVVASGTIWTKCGESTNLRMRTFIRTMSNSRMEQTMMTVDSTDITAGFIYHVQWRRCE